MKKLTTLSILAAAASMAVAEDKISLQKLHYQEDDDRIKVDDWVLSAELNPNVDNQVSVNVGLDFISGASPAWQARSGLAQPDNFAELNNLSDSSVYGVDASGYDVKRVEVPDEERRSFGISWLTRDKKRHELSVGFDFSDEPDYISRALSGSYMWFADASKNTSFNVGASLQANESKVFDERFNSSWDDLTSLNIELGIGQVVSSRSVINANVFIIRDQGYLTNHYQTIIRQYDSDNDGVVEDYLAAEHRPDERLAFGSAVKWMIQWKPYYATHTGYRFYSDDWGIVSNTVDFKQYFTPIDSLALGVVLRYYNQTAADFYRDADSKNPAFSIKGYGSADHRMGDFSAWTTEFSASFEIQKTVALNAQLGRYEHSEDFGASWLALGVTVKQ